MPARNPTENLIRRALRRETPYGQIHNGYSAFDDFTLLPQAAQTAVATNQNWDYVCSGTEPPLAFGGSGAVAMSTNLADNATGSLFPVATSKFNLALVPSTSNEIRFETLIGTPSANLTTTGIFAGLRLTVGSNNATFTQDGYATDNADQIIFGFDPDVSTTKWQVFESINGTDATASATNTPDIAVSSLYRLTIIVGNDLKARCYINDVLAYTSNAFSGDENLKPFVGNISRAGSAAARPFSLYWIRTAYAGDA